jgi:hypothetical protein
VTQPVPAAVASPPPVTERVALRRGSDVYTVAAADAPTMLAQGFEPASEADLADAQRRAAFASNPLATVAAGALGAARTASFGLSDVALTQGAQLLGGDEARQATARALQTFEETSPTATMAGEAAGLFAPGAAAKLLRATEGGSLAARAAARGAQALALPAEGAALAGEAAAAAARRAVGATLGEGATGLAARLAQRAIPGAAQGAVEAGLFGAGQAISQSAIKDEPLTAEAIAAAAGHAALLGGSIGGGLGALSGIGAHAAERAAQALRRETVTAERTATEVAASREATREAEREATESTTRTTVEEPVVGGAQPDAGEVAGNVLRGAADVAGAATGEIVQAGRAALKSTVEGVREGLANAPEALNKLADDQVIRSITGNYVKSSRLVERAEQMAPGFRKEFADWVEKNVPAKAGRPNLAATFDDELKLSAVQELRQEAGERIGASLEALDAANTGVVPDMAKVMEHIDNEVLAKMGRTPGMRPIAREVRAYLDEFAPYLPGKAANETERLPLSFREMHAARAFLDSEVIRYGAVKDTARTEAFQQIRDILEKELIRAGDEAAAKAGSEFKNAYVAAKKDYRFAATAEEALTNKVAHGHKNNVFSITDPLWSGVGASVGGLPGAVVGGALNQLRRRAGNEIAAVTLRNMARIEGIQGVADRVVTKLDVGIDRVIRAGEAAASAPSRTTSAARAVRRTVVETTTKATREREYQRTVSSVRAAASDQRATAERVEQALGPVAAAAPNVSRDAVSTVLRGATFLQQKIPVAALRADSVSPHLDEPRASADEQARFLRYARAVNDPQTVVDDMAQGKLTREAAEAVRVVYPRLYQQMQTTALRRLAELRKPMGYPQRVQLSILLGVPADPSLSPDALSQLQGTYGSPEVENATPSGGGVPSAQPGPQLRNKLTISQEYATATQATEAQ